MPQVQRTRSGKTSRPEPIMEPMTAADGVDFEIIELFFFAYRAFTSDPDAILEKGDMGRAHHRVLHFVNREPGMTVAALLDTLKITKQSLARVLKQLIDKGYICQIAGPRTAASVAFTQRAPAENWRLNWPPRSIAVSRVRLKRQPHRSALKSCAFSPACPTTAMEARNDHERKARPDCRRRPSSPHCR